jgi:predicted DNA binding protein
MELLTWGPTAAVTSLAWYDAGRDVVSSLLATVDFVEMAQYVERDGGTYAFTVQDQFALDPAVVDLLERARVAFLPPVVFEASGVARFEAVGEQSALSSFYDTLGSELSVEIEQVEPFQRQPAPRELTDRQRAALEVAVDVGYYEVPRIAGVEAVASRLDCAPSTAGELLRKAERAAVTGVVESDRDEP